MKSLASPEQGVGGVGPVSLCSGIFCPRLVENSKKDQTVPFSSGSSCLFWSNCKRDQLGRITSLGHFAVYRPTLL